MRTGWVNSIPNVNGGVHVIERRPQGVSFGPVTVASPPKGVGHTTEGSQEIPAYGNNAPHFTIGKNGIYQHRPFGDMAGTLANPSGGVETNRLVRIQFELVEFSELQPWLPESDKQVDMLASVFEFAQKDLGVPENHVWPDEQDSGTIAVTSYRRRQSKFPGVAGWYYHAEVPENSHWDMGDFQATKVMKREPITMIKAYAVYLNYLLGKNNPHWESQRLTPFFETERQAKLFAFEKRKTAILRAMSGLVKSEARGKVITARKAFPRVVVKRVNSADVRG